MAAGTGSGAQFVDRVVLHVAAGNGGNGCASVHREKFKPLGGPDGANGGRGGDVILEVDSNSASLLEYHRRPHRKAGNGKQGQGGHRTGADGGDVLLPVPDGTMVKSSSGEVLADMVGEGTRYVVAQGGRGGLGNAALASAKRKAPGFALLGEEGDSSDVVLELKSVADVALVGFPSAGKSSLIAALSAAKPKIAAYPFTTLVPNLGVVSAGETTYTIADVPGLIEGASDGKGLGLEFLRHIERSSTLAHVLDCATLEPGRDPVSDFEVIERELQAYDRVLGDRPLSDRPRLVVLNKVDVPDARDLAELVRPEFEKRGFKVYEVSAASHEGLRELSFAMAEMVAEHRASLPHGRADQAGHPAQAGRRRRRVRGQVHGRQHVPDHRGQAGPVAAADRLRQRGGGGLPRRPAGPARRGGGARQGGRRRGRHRPDRHRRRVDRLRLGARGRVRVRRCRTARHRPPPGRIPLTAP